MPLDTSIALQTKPVEPPSNFLNTAASIMNLRNSGAELSLRQQQIKQAQAQTADLDAQAQDRARKLKDQNTLQEIFSDPEAHKKLIVGDMSPISGKVSPDTEIGVQQSMQKLTETRMTLSKSQLEQRNQAVSALAGSLDSLLQLKKEDGSPDYEAINANVPNVVSGLDQAGVWGILGIDPSTLGKNPITDVKQIHQLAGAVGADAALTDKALGRQKEIEATNASKALAAKDTAQGHLAEVEANLKANGVSPETITAQIAAMGIDPNSATGKMAVQAGLGASKTGNPGDASKAIMEVIKESPEFKARVLQAETPAKVEQAKAEFAATAPQRQQERKDLADYNRAGNLTNQQQMVDFRNAQPTAQTRSMAETAPKVIDLVDRVGQLIDQQEKDLGPGSSRMREFLAGKIGAKDTEFSKLRTDVGLLQTALMRMHVGARGGDTMMAHFADLINSAKQDPDNMRAALGEIKQYAQEVAASGKRQDAPAADALPGGITLADIEAEMARRKKK